MRCPWCNFRGHVSCFGRFDYNGHRWILCNRRVRHLIQFFRCYSPCRSEQMRAKQGCAQRKGAQAKECAQSGRLGEERAFAALANRENERRKGGQRPQKMPTSGQPRKDGERRPRQRRPRRDAAKTMNEGGVIPESRARVHDCSECRVSGCGFAHGLADAQGQGQVSASLSQGGRPAYWDACWQNRHQWSWSRRRTLSGSPIPRIARPCSCRRLPSRRGASCALWRPQCQICGERAEFRCPGPMAPCRWEQEGRPLL